MPIRVEPSTEPGLPPALGYPVLVESDGKISLPLLTQRLNVRGLSLAKAREAVFEAYSVQKEIIQKDARVLVTLQRRRRYHVLVVRQDSAQPGGAGSAGGGASPFGIGNVGVAQGTSGRGTGVALDMAAYENDVMTALAQSGGLPGFGALHR